MLHIIPNLSLLLLPPCGHRYETTSSDDSSSEDSSSSGSEEDDEKEFGEKEEYKNVEGKGTREEFQPEGAEDVDKKDEEGSSDKQEMRERWVKENLCSNNNKKKGKLNCFILFLLFCLNSMSYEFIDMSFLLLWCGICLD